MLDEPHNVRLHTRRAILGSYNLKDPPRSPNISYSGPQWVPDSLHAAWCTAKTLMHYMPDNTPVTYESVCRMLKLVLPDQRECCEVGIELLLMANRLMPERVLSDAHSSIISKPSRQESQCSHKSLRQGSRSASSLQDTIDEIVRNHMALMDKLAKESKEFQSQMRKTAFPDPAPTPCLSGSASGIAPHNEGPRLVSSAAKAKVYKPETRSLLDGVTMTCPYASRGFVEPECTLTMPCERIGSVAQAVSLGAPTTSREQSRKTIPISEPPRGSPLSDDSSSSETVYGSIGSRGLGKGLAAMPRPSLSCQHAPVLPGSPSAMSNTSITV